MRTEEEEEANDASTARKKATLAVIVPAVVPVAEVVAAVVVANNDPVQVVNKDPRMAVTSKAGPVEDTLNKGGVSKVRFVLAKAPRALPNSLKMCQWQCLLCTNR